MADIELSHMLSHTHAGGSGPELLDVDGVDVRYNQLRALEQVSFRLLRGERLAVVGPNGAGKSTLFKVIAGILRPSAGTVAASNGQVSIAYVPQRGQVDWSFPVSVADVVLMGRTARIGLFRWPSSHDRTVVRRCLEAVKLDQLAGRQVGELSGGQQQRVFIARALAQEAELLLMDEPLTGLDVTSQEDIFDVLDELRHSGVTVVVSTHDLNQAAERFDRVMLLNRQMIAIGQAADVFTHERLASAYGGHMRLVPTSDGLLVLGDTHCDGHHH